MKSTAELRVLELSSSASAAYAGKLFAGLGAQVDYLRRPNTPTFFTPEEHAWFNTGKRELSLEPGETSATLEHLIADCDVLIDDWGVGELAALGFDSELLTHRFPHLIYCQITPFGASGPYRDFAAEDITLYAMAGLMHSTGDGAREPLNAAAKIARLTAGLHAYVACFMALLRRERDGLGDVIDLSVHESALENYELALTHHLHLKQLPRRNGDDHPYVPWRTYPCADGVVALIGGPVRKWLDAAPLFGEPRLLTPEFAHMAERIKKRAEFEALLRPYLQAHGKREIVERGQALGMAWAWLATLPEVLEDPQLRARGFFIEHQLDGETYRMPGAPFRGPHVNWRDAPAPAHAIPAAAIVDQTKARAQPATRTAKQRTAPLAGVRIVDFTHDWAGPHTTRLLADFGAEVVKIEYPKLLDSMRGGFTDRVNQHPRFWHLHRGKRSVALDLKNPDHLRVCRELIRISDIVVENSRPGVMAKLGLGYETLRALKPDLIMLSMSAYGADGPRAHWAGYGGGLEAQSGLQSLTGYEESGPRYRVREMDVLNSIFGACALLTALWHRARTGEGQWIDFSEYEGCIWYIGEFFTQALREGQPPVRGNRHPRFAPQGCYPCTGQDRWLALTVRDDGAWKRLAELLGGEALDSRYAQVAARQQRHDELDVLIADWTRQREAYETMRELQARGIPAGVVCTAADLAADPHLAARGWFWRTPDGVYPGVPFRFRDGGAKWHSRGPDLGEYNAELFARFAPGCPLPELSPSALRTAFEMR
ncbi:MAG: CoA transferase [Nevskia sp.]|nr:CoA transferase [Nevskia sp.]